MLKLSRRPLSGKPARALMARSFSERVRALISLIPAGKVSTYKEIAHALGCRAYRAVGNACNKNPYAPIVPCHRVVASDGSLGGFAFGAKKKEELLNKEGIVIHNNHIVDFEKKLYIF